MTSRDRFIETEDTYYQVKGNEKMNFICENGFDMSKSNVDSLTVQDTDINSYIHNNRM